MEKTMDKIVQVAKARGFVYPGSEIYGGLANTWDYGNLGVELKNNVKRAWWKKFIQENPYNVGVDCAILMNPQTWVASGHLGGFSDPLMDCKECHERFRADKLIEDFAQENNIELDGSVDGWSNEKMVDFIESHNIPCPSCGKHNFTDIRQFNLMFKTFQGVTEDAKNTVYLRPETAQGIFVNFKNVQRTSRKKIPFGIGQIGKSFRNEITPGNFTFRTREFEQMELEFFCEPGTDLEWFQYWRAFCRDWLLSLGIKEDEMRLRDHSAEELCFYSKGTTDIEFLFPFGWGELWGIADRTDYDLTQHQNVSGQDMTYFDDTKGEKYIPYVIEPSLGADRVVLAVALSFLPVAVSMTAGNRLAEQEKEISKKNEHFVSIVNELLSGFPVIKSFRAETQASRLFSQRNEQAEEAKKNKRRTEQLISLLANDAGIIAQMGIFLAGAWLAISGKGVTAGVVIVFVQLMNYILNPISQVPLLWSNRKAAIALMEKLSDALSENVREEGREKLNGFSEKIEMKNLTYGYEPESPVCNTLILTCLLLPS